MKRLFALRSLRARLLALVMVVVAPAVALVVIENCSHRRVVMELVRADASRSAHFLATHQSARIAHFRSWVQGIAAQPVLGGADITAIRTAIVVTLAGSDAASLAVVDADGSVIAGTPDDPVPLDRPATPAADGSHAPRLSWVAADGIPRVVAVAPIGASDGAARRVLVATLSLGLLGDAARAAGVDVDTVILLTRADGRVLFRHPAEAGAREPAATYLTARGRNASGVEAASFGDGVERLAGSAELGFEGGPPLRLVVGVPTGSVTRAAAAALWRDLAWIGIAALVVVLGAWLFGDQMILRRLDRVVRAASRLARGDLASRAGIHGTDEIARVGQAFDEMAERMQAMLAGERDARAGLELEVQRLVEDRTREISALGRMGQLLHASRSEKEAASVVADFLGEVAPSDRGSIMLVGAARRRLKVAAAFGLDTEATLGLSAPLACCWAARRGNVHVVGPGQGVPCEHVHDASVALCVPMVAKGRVLGVIHVAAGGDADESWIAARRRLVTAVAEQATLALANLQLQSHLREQSVRDPLTNLLNRRFLEERLSSGEGFGPEGTPIGLLMIDIDHFKEFNDVHGHAVGDAVLVAVARRLSRLVRGEDFVCRYGGEEFVVVLPGLTLERTLRRAEEIRRRIGRKPVAWRGRAFGPVTVSIGVASSPEHGQGLAETLKEADAALYAAKTAGRDRVAVAERRYEPAPV